MVHPPIAGGTRYVRMYMYVYDSYAWYTSGLNWALDDTDH